MLLHFSSFVQLTVLSRSKVTRPPRGILWQSLLAGDASRSNLELELGKPRFPRFDLPTGETEHGYLRKVAYEGLERKYDARTASSNMGLFTRPEVGGIL